jgi:hypothetical protein
MFKIISYPITKTQRQSILSDIEGKSRNYSAIIKRGETTFYNLEKQAVIKVFTKCVQVIKVSDPNAIHTLIK